ncbi:phosphotransferase family protein [Neobacillus sp. MM2021_6]|uniref:phosphotransferase family protein n=1 Tax=Bacillaceae TaxID=186817 RepID=UPI00140948CC|nr:MULTISPECIES: phosphotransferase family protein [Bacillaceae]MBO0962052.1 phosphotransferase family protein [Neobacillus sp. MM2021_6]NHC19959.1 phosphotransferase family protein [Bacillus sp. MM2020_4]
MRRQMNMDTIPVRKGEELDVLGLETYLRENVKSLPGDPLEVLQFSAGHSNLTYQLKMGDWEAVLRRPPLGPVAPKAHDMGREFKILSELNPIFSVAPEPFLFTENQAIVGSPFLVMERKNGVVIDTSFPKEVQVTKELCRHLSEVMVEKLVELHALDYKQTRLGEISKPEGFMERQVHGWIGRYERAKTDDIAVVDSLKKWLVEHTPKHHESTIIHYDYKFNNAMFNEKLTEMVGLFDWEMTTVGDPLADLGVAMSYWNHGDDSEALINGLGKSSVTAVHEGFFTRNEFIERYAKKSGRDVTNFNFYLTFAYFKLAVIGQQIYYRYKKGQTNDTRFANFNHFVKNLILHAASIADEKQ